jgi:hypothetical protein
MAGLFAMVPLGATGYARGWEESLGPGLEANVGFVLLVAVCVVTVDAALNLRFVFAGPANQPLQRTPCSPTNSESSASGPATLS